MINRVARKCSEVSAHEYSEHSRRESVFPDLERTVTLMHR